MAVYDDTIRMKFSPKRHAKITANACADILTDEQLSLVILHNTAQDLRQFESDIHFDNCTFKESVDYVWSEWKIINERGYSLDQENLEAFGRLIHTVQDFYSHSNWVELHVEQKPIPVWNLEIDKLPPKIVSGTWGIGNPKRCSGSAPHHDEMCKDSPSKGIGGKIIESGPNKGKNYYTVAEDVAIRATRKQIEKLVQKKLKSLSILPGFGGITSESIGILINDIKSFQIELQELKRPIA